MELPACYTRVSVKCSNLEMLFVIFQLLSMPFVYFSSHNHKKLWFETTMYIHVFRIHVAHQQQYSDDYFMFLTCKKISFMSQLAIVSSPCTGLGQGYLMYQNNSKLTPCSTCKNYTAGPPPCLRQNVVSNTWHTLLMQKSNSHPFQHHKEVNE